MRFLLDESVDARLQAHLQHDGHEVTSIRLDHRPGMPDDEVLRVAREEGRILLTNDRDFGELIFRQRLAHGGVVLFRLQSVSLEAKVNAMHDVLTHHSDELNAFLVVSEAGVRVRRHPRD
ncbi:MAG: DUF5615 family PIN-like protein [Dehalococcoidia bacterium]